VFPDFRLSDRPTNHFVKPTAVLRRPRPISLSRYGTLSLCLVNYTSRVLSRKRKATVWCLSVCLSVCLPVFPVWGNRVDKNRHVASLSIVAGKTPPAASVRFGRAMQRCQHSYCYSPIRWHRPILNKRMLKYIIKLTKRPC